MKQNEKRNEAQVTDGTSERKMKPSIKKALAEIDHMKVLGYLLGERKSKGVVYLVNSKTGEEKEFSCYALAQIYAQNNPVLRS